MVLQLPCSLGVRLYGFSPKALTMAHMSGCLPPTTQRVQTDADDPFKSPLADKDDRWLQCLRACWEEANLPAAGASANARWRQAEWLSREGFAFRGSTYTSYVPYTKVTVEDPCSSALPEMLAVAQMMPCSRGFRSRDHRTSQWTMQDLCSELAWGPLAYTNPLRPQAPRVQVPKYEGSTKPR